MITLDKEPPLSDSVDSSGDKKKGNVGCIAMIVVFVVFSLLIIINALINQGRPPRPGGGLSQCQSNMKNIATALEIYSVDNQGEYPDDIYKISPNYMKSMPTCAMAGMDSYSVSYGVSVDYDHYTFFCSGHNHQDMGVPPNYPQYSDRTGLIPRP